MTEHEFLNLKELTVKRTYIGDLPPAQQQTPVRFILKSEFLTGNWANAVEASINYGTNGAAAGLGATISADMILPNKTFPSGAYYPLSSKFALVPQFSNLINAVGLSVAFQSELA